MPDKEYRQNADIHFISVFHFTHKEHRPRAGFGQEEKERAVQCKVYFFPCFIGKRSTIRNGCYRRPFRPFFVYLQRSYLKDGRNRSIRSGQCRQIAFIRKGKLHAQCLQRTVQRNIVFHLETGYRIIDTAFLAIVYGCLQNSRRSQRIRHFIHRSAFIGQNETHLIMTAYIRKHGTGKRFSPRQIAMFHRLVHETRLQDTARPGMKIALPRLVHRKLRVPARLKVNRIKQIDIDGGGKVAQYPGNLAMGRLVAPRVDLVHRRGVSKVQRRHKCPIFSSPVWRNASFSTICRFTQTELEVCTETKGLTPFMPRISFWK